MVAAARCTADRLTVTSVPMQVAVLNGVNLNMLGRRDPAQYGTLTLSQLETQIYEWALELNMTVRCWHQGQTPIGRVASRSRVRP